MSRANLESVPDISEITNVLFISSWPKKSFIQEIQKLNIRLILSMHLLRPYAGVVGSHARLLWLPSFDNPLLPMRISTLKRGVIAALPVIEQGYGVMCHCREGKHRSVAMACCVLIGLGFSVDDAMQLVKSKRPLADPYSGYIQVRIRKFDRFWNNLTGEPS